MNRSVTIGSVTIGGGAPVAVQSMLNVHSSDIEGNVAQAVALEQAGCEIVRVSVPDHNAVRLIPAIKLAVSMPVVADIHFAAKLAIESVLAGADKIRINPGNIGDADRMKAVVNACKQKNVPIRIGVNAGSLEKDILAQYGKPTANALIESAARHIQLIEQNDYDNIVLSMKSSDLPVMIQAYRAAHSRWDYPLHLGVTEAGTYRMGVVKSAIGIGSLLCDDIGDTIRVSLTDDPILEIQTAWDILNATGARRRGVQIISCPTCGRTEIDIVAIAREIEEKTKHITKPLTIAVMGCVVNGPGEAAQADIGIAAGKDSAVLFAHGDIVKKITGDIAAQLLEEIHKMI